jgi:hypothetical protein
VFQVEDSQATANPSVKVVKDARRVREPEVFLPAAQILAQPLAYLLDASPACPLRDVADAVLHRG